MIQSHKRVGRLAVLVFGLASWSLSIAGCGTDLSAPAGSPPTGRGSVAAESHTTDRAPDAGDSEPAVAPSPEEAFENARQAAAAGNWKRFCDYLTPEARDTLAVTLMIVADQAVQQAQRARQTAPPEEADRIQRRITPIESALSRHRIPDNVLLQLDNRQLEALARSREGQLDREVLEPLIELIEDRGEFVADMLGVLQSARGRRSVVSLKGELSDVTLAGEKANATLIAHDDVGIETRRDLDFRRVAGNWRIDFRLR